MKKLLLRCLAVVMVVVLMSVGVPTEAMAAGESGTCGENSFTKYEDLVMKPGNGETYIQGNAIPWTCSGKISPAGAIGNFGWLVSGGMDNGFTIKEVRLNLYKMVTKTNWTNGTYESYEFIRTLFSKSFDNVRTAKFSGSGTMNYNLEPGMYCIRLQTDDRTIKEKKFTIIAKPQQENKNGYVTIEYIDENWTVVKSETKLLAPGTHTLYNEYNVSGYEKVGDLSRTVKVNNDGTADWEKVEFYVKWTEQNTDKVVDPVTTAPVTAPPITPPPVTNPEFPIINETCYIPDNGNNVRSGPGTNYELLGQVNAGNWFVIYDYQLGSTGKDWYKIYYNGQFGWISSGIVELNGHTDGTVSGERIWDDAQNFTNVSVVTPVPAYEQQWEDYAIWGLTNQRLSTRSGPGTNYSETGTYNYLANEWVEIRSRAWDDRNGIWWVEVDIEGRWLWTGYKRFDSSTVSLEEIPINPYY